MSFFTADICDEHDDKVLVLDNDFTNYGAKKKACGEVITIKLFKSNIDLVNLLKNEDGTGKVVVVDVQKEYYAVVGENLMNFAKNNNYEAIIVNGYIRDTQQIKDIDVALYAIGECPRKYIPKVDSQRDIELTFSSVTFNNGDYVYLDSDGLILSKEKII